MDTKNIFWLAISHAAVMYISLSLFYIFLFASLIFLFCIQFKEEEKITSWASPNEGVKGGRKQKPQISLVFLCMFFLYLSVENCWKILFATTTTTTRMKKRRLFNFSHNKNFPFLLYIFFYFIFLRRWEKKSEDEDERLKCLFARLFQLFVKSLGSLNFFFFKYF